MSETTREQMFNAGKEHVLLRAAVVLLNLLEGDRHGYADYCQDVAIKLARIAESPDSYSLAECHQILLAAQEAAEDFASDH